MANNISLCCMLAFSEILVCCSVLRNF